MDLPALKFLKTSQFEDLADGYHALSAGAGQGKDDIENSISAKMRVAKLAGLGADAAHKQLSEVAENFHYIQVECGLVSTALRAFVSDISPAKAKFDAAIADAAAHKFTVADSGFITYPRAERRARRPRAARRWVSRILRTARWPARTRTSTPTPTTPWPRTSPTGSVTPCGRPRRPTTGGRRSCAS
nr:hypothetical protein OH826_00105 [Streptomyces sp. NBC_00899]WSX81518.1 hypothetical protein OH826_51390 [Streptomyces sp. NBC_00899]